MNKEGVADYITVESFEDGRLTMSETNHKDFEGKYAGQIDAWGDGSGRLEVDTRGRHYSWTWKTSGLVPAAAGNGIPTVAALPDKVDLTGRWATAQFRNNAGQMITVSYIIVQKGESVKMILDFPGQPHRLIYDAQMDDPGRLSGKSRSSSNSEENPNWTTERMVMVDANHIRSTQSPFFIAKVAGPDSLTAADMVPVSESSKPYLRAQPFDLNGVWQSLDKQTAMFKLAITQKDGDLTMRMVDWGGIFFRAHYTQNPSIAGQGIAIDSDPKNPKWVEKALFVDDPDHLRYNAENRIFPLFRVSNPAAHDLECDSQNSNHVARHYAMLRGRAADAEHDFASAKCWLTISADQGYAPAQSLLAAVLVRRPDAGEADYAAAFQLAQKSAQLGDIAGQLELASFYRDGKGAPQDPQKAQFWTQRAQQSNAAAQWKRWNSNVFMGLSPLDIAGMALKAANATIADIDESARELSCADGHRSDCYAH